MIVHSIKELNTRLEEGMSEEYPHFLSYPISNSNYIHYIVSREVTIRYLQRGDEGVYLLDKTSTGTITNEVARDIYEDPLVFFAPSPLLQVPEVKKPFGLPIRIYMKDGQVLTFDTVREAAIHFNVTKACFYNYVRGLSSGYKKLGILLIRRVHNGKTV